MNKKKNIFWYFVIKMFGRIIWSSILQTSFKLIFFFLSFLLGPKTGMRGISTTLDGARSRSLQLEFKTRAKITLQHLFSNNNEVLNVIIHRSDDREIRSKGILRYTKVIFFRSENTKLQQTCLEIENLRNTSTSTLHASVSNPA